MIEGNDCSLCIHTNVCGMKFRVKDAIELYKNVHLTVCCDEFMAAVPKETPRRVVRQKVVRRTKA